MSGRANSSLNGGDGAGYGPAEETTVLLGFALDRIAEAALLVDEDGRFRFVNDQACRFYGKMRADLLELSVTDIDLEHTLDDWRDRWNELRVRRSLIFESRHRNGDGGVVPVEISASYVEYDGRGYNLALIRDISDRKRAIALLHKSEKEYRTLMENLPGPVIRYDRECRRTYLNPAALRLLGGGPGELLGKTSAELRPDTQALRRYRDRIRQVVTTGQAMEFEITTAMLRPAGEASPRVLAVRIVAERDEDGDVTGALAIGQDVTDLKQRERRYREIFNNVLAAMCLLEAVDSDRFRCVEANAAFAAVLGRPPEEIGGRPVDYLGSDQLARVLTELSRRCVAARATIREDVSLDVPSGRRLYSVSFVPLRGLDEGVNRVLAIFSDVTERKQAEEKIYNLNEELEQRVRQRTAELEASNRELEAFSYSVSHDLRAPLRVIEGFATVLLRNYSDRLDEMGGRYLTAISRNTARMGVLIDDILAFARLSRHEMTARWLDMPALVREAFEEARSGVPDRDVVLRVGDLPPAWGDRSMVRQVLSNLFDNALKFTALRDEAVIEVTGAEAGDDRVYLVRDNGVGFDMRYMDKMFGVFERLHRVDEFEGTGIGLAIVDRIIRRLGGRVWAEGTEGEGASLYFTLPGRPPSTAVRP